MPYDTTFNSTSDSPELNGLRVLVADASYQFREAVRGMLRDDIGVAEIIEARHGAQAWELLKQIPCDLVIADAGMEPLGGVELTRMIRSGEAEEVDSCMPVIIVSGRAELSEIVAARDAGANDYLAKPLPARILKVRLHAVVDRPRPFVRAQTFFGPDRRRHSTGAYTGVERRQRAPEVVAVS